MNREAEQPVTIYTVAEHAGVSIATVSRVLQGSTPSSAATKARVLDAVRELGYVPLRAGRAQALRLEQHGLVLYSLGGPYYSELLVGYESRAPEFGQSVSLISTESICDVDDRVLDLATKMDGMVLAHGTISAETVAEVSRRVPTLLLNSDPVAGCAAVNVENRRATAELVHHLVRDHRYRRLWFVGDPEQARDAAHRYRGFTDALSAAGLSEVRPPLRLRFGAAHLNAAANVVATNGRAQALVCANDELALGLIRQLRRRGVRVPDDVAVTGWDDVMAARYTDLTTVRQPAREVGRVAAQRLHELITRASVEFDEMVVPSEVVLRTSCGCPEPDA
ncbi:MAG: LacI family DNA-binding transcriptional regulator [Micropruina sp.]|uniref:LacI family DNA-binding transcriptional regulator n=1 Tax=Micropruina sp. TaxID=2737536 RepID=UPI0039E522C1